MHWFMDVPQDIGLYHIETIINHCLQEYGGREEGGERREGRGGREGVHYPHSTPAMWDAIFQRCKNELKCVC